MFGVQGEGVSKNDILGVFRVQKGWSPRRPRFSFKLLSNDFEGNFHLEMEERSVEGRISVRLWFLHLHYHL